MKAALLVLGMHRSGTSALTRVLSLLGAELPGNLMPGVEGFNDLGHWESLDLMAIHDEMLASAGSSWHDVAAFPADWHRSPPADGFRGRILGVLERDYRDAPLFVIKDPRACRFVPFWLDLLDRFGATAHAILPVRNPLEVAASLRRRDGFSTARGAMLWLRHTLDAEHATRGRPRSVVTYDALLEDWGATVEKIGAELGLAWPRESHRAASEIEQFLSASYRHHLCPRGALGAHSQVARWVEQAYGAMLQLAEADGPGPRERLDAIRASLAEAEHAFGPLLAGTELDLERSRDRVRGLEAELAGQAARIRELEQAEALYRGRAAAAEGRAAGLEAELAGRDARLGTLEADLREREARLQGVEAAQAGRDSRIAWLEATLAEHRARADFMGEFRYARDQQASMLRRLIYESEQAITRDLAVLDNLGAIEARSGQVLDALRPPGAAAPGPGRPGRRWWRHLPVPPALRARLAPPARRVLGKLGVRTPARTEAPG